MKLRVLILLAYRRTAACHREPGTAGCPVHPGRRPAAAPSQAGESAGTDRRNGRGRGSGYRPGLRSSSKFDLLQRPVEGQPLEVAIALLPQIAADPRRLR